MTELLIPDLDTALADEPIHIGGLEAMQPARDFPDLGDAQVIDMDTIAGLVPPKCPRQPVFAPKAHWLPCNEKLAVALGHAQHALRLLDDQRALVHSVAIHSDFVMIDLARAPKPGKAQWPHVDTQRGRVMVMADLAGADQSVLLRWPLSESAS